MSQSPLGNYITFNYVWKTIGASLVACVLWFANDKYESDKSYSHEQWGEVKDRLSRIEAVLFIPAIHPQAMK